MDIPTVDLIIITIDSSSICVLKKIILQFLLAEKICVRMIQNTSWCYMDRTGSVSGVARTVVRIVVIIPSASHGMNPYVKNA